MVLFSLSLGAVKSSAGVPSCSQRMHTHSACWCEQAPPCTHTARSTHLGLRVGEEAMASFD